MTDPQPTGEGPGPGKALPPGLLQVAAVVLLSFLAFQLAQPILPALLWGGLLATVSAHGYERIVSRTKGNRGLGILIIGLVYLVVLVGPLLFFALEAIGHAPYLASLPEQLSSGKVLTEIEWIEDAAEIETGLPDWLRSLNSHFAERMSQILPHLGGLAGWLAARVGDLGTFMFEFLLGCVTALALLYNRFAVRAVLARILKTIGGDFAQELMQHTFDSTRAAFRGVIAAALAQSVLSAAALIVAGVPGVILLTAMTFLLALVQIGPLVTAAVACGILLAQGNALAAGLILIWFLVVVTSVDNLIRPYFASRANDTPAFLTFLGALGGLLAFGLIGVFVGPVLTSLLYRLLIAWAGKEDEAVGSVHVGAIAEKADP